MKSRFLIVLVLGALTASLGFVENPPAAEPAAQAPASMPAATEQAPASSQPTGERTPRQLEILRDLLRERERPTPIIPPQPRTTPAPVGRGMKPTDPADSRLLPDGASLIERPGRFVLEGQRAMFIVRLDGETEPRALELHRNQLLEYMERSATSGLNEFTVSGEVSRYRGKNYLYLWKVLERVSNGNIAP